MTIQASNFEIRTDVVGLATRIASDEPLVTPKILPQLEAVLRKLKDKSSDNWDSVRGQFSVDKSLSGGHLLPITNVSIDKHGDICATGSYDRTCKIWNTRTGTMNVTLAGHEDAVYTMSLAIPERLVPFAHIRLNEVGVLTGSFDKTARWWSLREDDGGECLCVMRGHTAQIVAVDVTRPGQMVATSSIDRTTRLFSAATGQNLATLSEHTGEVVANQFDNSGSTVITGSFDSTVKIWDTRTARCIATLFGHTAELSVCCYDFGCHMIASGSLDCTAKLWDVRRTDCCRDTIGGHTDEVLDVSFDSVGRRLATASSDNSACIWDVNSGDLITAMIGHTDEVSKVVWEPAGHHLLTTSQDHISMFWNTETGECLQELKGHKDHVFSAEISYLGDTILTASKDNTCVIWRQSNSKIN
ncbi:Six-bladed beta-propeller, TolB-like,WD40-repeat-containing domain,WD40 repeat, conserved site,WD40/YVTN [Cinara cedri]|uniref:Six-bladed beta-propeller, TolB-like,WD40-repeat-containing domain,WD40 repeat, conserved site,WD40/YVTN n=1 Tax=Cinara cedri TaxID=506608 RepID=A0A5E4M5E3_9HEMI|nr:Six-bladed beta-propeller, TolB-like,WD40-repeat-containing domain,WD40 repeat, conserved site,WD40/YVTN [Cinara cedri]